LNVIMGLDLLGRAVPPAGTGFSVKEVAGKKAKAVFGTLDGGKDGDGQVRPFGHRRAGLGFASGVGAHQGRIRT
jgi:hypothetical protein